jgi:hypothetical protein
MNIVTANAEVHAALAPLVQPAEIRDANGNILGYFTPDAERIERVYAEAATHFDCEELKRRKESDEEVFTTAEVLDFLKKLKPI